MISKQKQQDKDLKNSCRIVTPAFRVAFPNVFKPSGFRGGNLKYSLVMLFKKEQDLKEIKKALKSAKIMEWGANPRNWPENIAMPITDGDSPKTSAYDGFKGCWAIKASSSAEAKPSVVDYPGSNPIIDPSEFYPGCVARAQIFARVWEFPEKSGRFGIQFILDHVQKLKDAKPFGSKKAAKDVFAIEVDGDDEYEDVEVSDGSNDEDDFSENTDDDEAPF